MTNRDIHQIRRAMLILVISANISTTFLVEEPMDSTNMCRMSPFLFLKAPPIPTSLGFPLEAPSKFKWMNGFKGGPLDRMNAHLWRGSEARRVMDRYL